MLSRLGSRLTLIPEPDRGRIRILPLGLHLPELAGLSVRIEAGGKTIVFPDPSGTLPERIQQITAPSRIAYRIPIEGGTFVWELWSPFAFGDPTWRSAPVMFVRAGVESDLDPVSAKVAVTLVHGATGDVDRGIARIALPFPFAIDQGSLAAPLGVAEHLRSAVAPPGAESFIARGTGTLALGGLSADGWRAVDGRLTVSIDAPARGAIVREAALAFHTASAILQVDGAPQPFAYASAFRDAGDVIDRALAARERIAAMDREDVAALAIPPTPPELMPLASLGLQSFLANTWLVKGAGGVPFRYSEWEGEPRFHATMDVTYDNSPFYVFFAPDLLADLLRHWPDYAQDGHMPHDFGQHLVIGKTVYPVRMAVEEDASFLLLHALHANFGGDASLAREQAALLEKLARSLLASDTDGDGLPDSGVINTFDDAPPILNATKNQLYLGVKATAALDAYARMPLDLPVDLREAIAARHRLATATIEGFWLGDHYPISLSPKLDLVQKVITPHLPGVAKPDPFGYSNYLAHGLVPLFLCGRSIPEISHIAEHLASAHARTATPYGDAHVPGSENVWVSQNLWRDLAAMYLGAPIDAGDLVPRYLALEREAYRRKAEDPKWEPFADSSENVFLSSYAREASVAAWIWARHRISFSRDECRLTIGIPFGPGRLPLPFLRRGGRTPVLVWDRPEGPPARIESGDLLDGIRIEVGPPVPAVK